MFVWFPRAQLLYDRESEAFESLNKEGGMHNEVCMCVKMKLKKP